MSEMTVEDRAAIVLAAIPTLQLNNDQQRQLRDVLYTLNEAGELSDERHNETLLWGAIELVRAGLFTEDMRL
jgi:hypothetical protein